jgi:hypothetical protein
VSSEGRLRCADQQSHMSLGPPGQGCRVVHQRQRGIAAEVNMEKLPPGKFPPFGLVIQPELFAFPAEGVAMNPQSLGCL